MDPRRRGTALARQARDEMRGLARGVPLPRRVDGWAVAALALAVVLRLALTVLGWLPLNSDEGTIGLEAMHIAFRGEHPTFFYGQNYMGALEAYLAALSFRLFGVSIVTLRLGLIVLDAIFLIAVYLLARTLYDRRVARWSALLLALGSPAMFFRQLQAMGGEVETICFGALALLFAARLALSAGAPARHPGRRALTFAAWGLSAGLGLWSSFLVAPLVLASALLLVVGCRRELWGRMGLCLAVGLLVGAWPLIAYNLTAAPGQNSLQVFFALERAGGTGLRVGSIGLLPPLTGTIFVSMPYVLGAAPFCPLPEGSTWPVSGHSSALAVSCAAARGAWGLGWLALGVVSLALGARALVALWPGRGTWSAGARAQATRRGGQLAMLAGAGLTLLFYARSPAPALAPLDSSRYLVGLWVATPAILAPLLTPLDGRSSPALPPGANRIRLEPRLIRERIAAASAHRRGSRWRRLAQRLHPAVPAALLKARRPPHMRARRAALTFPAKRVALAAARAVTLALVALVLCRGVLATFHQVPGERRIAEADQVLIADFERLGVTRFFTDYWTCDRLMFESHERLICAVLSPQLRPGTDRYLPAQQAVWNDSHPAYAFPLGSPQAALAAQLARGALRDISPAACARDPNCLLAPRPGSAARVVDGYVVYQ